MTCSKLQCVKCIRKCASRLPIACAMPWARAGLIVYLAMYLRLMAAAADGELANRTRQKTTKRVIWTAQEILLETNLKQVWAGLEFDKVVFWKAKVECLPCLLMRVLSLVASSGKGPLCNFILIKCCIHSQILPTSASVSCAGMYICMHVCMCLYVALHLYWTVQIGTNMILYTHVCR